MVYIEMIQILLLAVIVRVSTTTRGKQEHAMMKVNKTGYFEEESFPTCNNGGKINLLSYQRCSTYQCNTSLSTKEKLVIHEMCSLKRTCVTSKFPQVNATINVTYQCLNNFEEFVDICENSTTSGDTPVHLLYRHNKNNSANYKTCNCQIKGNRSSFSVRISDVRLKSDTDGTCIQNKLYVEFQTFTCNDTKEDHGSVFNQIWKRTMTELMIKFNIIDSTVEPEMIYFAITPTVSGSIAVACHNRRRISAAFKGSAFKKTTPNDEDSTSSMTATIAGVCGCAVALILVSAAVFMRYRTGNWTYTKWITNLERLVERYIQQPRDESNIRQPEQCIGDDEYVELQKKSTAPMSKNCREAGFGEPSESYYDPVNNSKPVLGKVHAIEDTEDSTVYSYAEHKPEKRMIAACTQSSPSNPDDRTFSKVHGISNGDYVLNKHVYVKLLPDQETGAGESCDSVPLNTEMKLKGMSENHHSGTSTLKKAGGFNANEVNDTPSTYSFAKDLYQASITPQLNSRNPEEPLTYRGHNHYDSTSANKIKVSPSRNYDRAKKRDTSETSCASDDEHYDKIDGDRIPVHFNPNYDKLSK